jgi:predicted PurR-regulated permease PerM
MRFMEGRNISISITAGTVVKTLVILALAWLLFQLRDLVLVVLVAVVIASAIEPGVRWLRQRKIPRILAVLLIYLLLFGVFFGLFYFFLPSILEDFGTFIASVPTYIEALSRTNAFDTYSNILGLPTPSTITADGVMAGIRSVFGGGVSSPFAAATAIFGGVFSFILIIVFSFYFAVIETGVDDFLRIITPKKHQSYILDLWKRSQHKIGLWMQGQLILGVIIGVIVFLVLTILRVEHALLLAVIAGIFEIIPVFGPILSAVPAILIAFVGGGPLFAFVIACLYTLIQQFENHLIYPLVVTRVVGVPPLLVILALIIGGTLAGFLGVILSVPIAAIVQEFVKDIESGRFA